MTDNLTILNAVCEPISTPETPYAGKGWLLNVPADQTACTKDGTNPQTAVSNPLVLSPSFNADFSPHELPQKSAPLSSSLSKPPHKASTRRSRKRLRP